MKAIHREGPKVAAAALLLACVAQPAQAWTLINWNGGQVWGSPWTDTTQLTWQAASGPVWYRIYFDGVTDDYNHHLTPLPGLAAAVTITLAGVSADDKTWNFNYSVWNASKAPVTTSRVSIFGFDVTPDVKSAGVLGVFTNVGYNSNVPILQDKAEVCFSDKTGNANCSGGGSGGETLGQTGGGTFALTFAAATSQLSLSDPFVRYQDLSAPSLNIRGSSGVGEPVAWVPEPSAWALMIIGFAGAGVALRRRTRIAALNA